MSQREKRKSHNRAKLLAAAQNVFAQKGLGRAAARDIVRETDLATGTFYNYFDGTDQIFREISTTSPRAFVRFCAKSDCGPAAGFANASTTPTSPISTVSWPSLSCSHGQTRGLSRPCQTRPASPKRWPTSGPTSRSGLPRPARGRLRRDGLPRRARQRVQTRRQPRRSCALLLAPARGRRSRLGSASHVM